MSPIIINSEEFFDSQEAVNYLTPFIKSLTLQTLRVAIKQNGMKRYHQKIGANRSYYRKSDLDALKEMTPVEETNNHNGNHEDE